MVRTTRFLVAAIAASVCLLLGACSSEPESDSGAASTPAADSTSDTVKVGREPNEPFLVTADDLGIHSYTTQPQIPAKSIAISGCKGARLVRSLYA